MVTKKAPVSGKKSLLRKEGPRNSANGLLLSWEWTKMREQAAMLLAEGDKTVGEIAKICGVSYSGIEKWMTMPEFKARVAQHVETYSASIMKRGIALKHQRVHALNFRHGLMNKVIEERGKELAKSPVAGGGTGLLVRELKGIGKGKDFEIVEEYKVDTALLREMRETERQVAIETGTWDNEADKLPGSGGSGNKVTVEINYVNKPPLELEAQTIDIKHVNGKTNGHG